MGDFGPRCDRVDGDGSSRSSSRLLCPLKLLPPLAFASQAKRGAGGGVGGGGGGGCGGDSRRSRRCLLVLCGDGRVLNRLFTTNNGVMGASFLTRCNPAYFMGGPFDPPQ